MLSTVYEDLKEFHKYLNNFCAIDPSNSDIKASQTFFTNIESLKKKLKNHTDLINSMEEHSKE